MNNKGEITMEEIVKIIISLVGILILVALSVGLYSMVQKTKEKNQVLEILKQVTDKINSLETSDELTIAGPQRWYMFIFLNNNVCVAKCSKFDSDYNCLEEEKDTRRCNSVKKELNVEIPGGQILIYITDLKFEKQNEKVIISKK